MTWTPSHPDPLGFYFAPQLVPVAPTNNFGDILGLDQKTQESFSAVSESLLVMDSGEDDATALTLASLCGWLEIYFPVEAFICISGGSYRHRPCCETIDFIRGTKR